MLFLLWYLAGIAICIFMCYLEGQASVADLVVVITLGGLIGPVMLIPLIVEYGDTSAVKSFFDKIIWEKNGNRDKKIQK